MKVTGKIVPLGDKIFISDMEFGEEKTQGGIVMLSANGKAAGISPRWGKVWAVGDAQHEIKIGDWILIEHGRWTRTVAFEDENGVVTEVRMVDNKAIMMTADEKPASLYRQII